MKKILILMSLMVVGILICTKNNLRASSSQNSDFKIQFILARREGQRDILIAKEALQSHKLDDIKSAQTRLTATGKKLLAFINQLKANTHKLDATQAANDLKDIQEILLKIDEMRVELKETLDGQKVAN